MFVKKYGVTKIMKVRKSNQAYVAIMYKIHYGLVNIPLNEYIPYHQQ